MRAKKTQKGFTIVESLIALAVTGALLAATIILVSGQIAKHSFKESALNFEQSINGILNDTRVGYFDLVSNAPLTCGGSSSKSGDSDCVYIGKKVTIDGSARTITSESLFALDSDDPLSNPTPSFTVSSTDTDYLPSSLDFEPVQKSFYVLYKNYKSNLGSDVYGRGQAIGIYRVDASDPVINTTSSIEIKATDGTRKVIYCVGKDGSPTVTKYIGADTCP